MSENHEEIPTDDLKNRRRLGAMKKTPARENVLERLERKLTEREEAKDDNTDQPE
jgi:hypothetical protein